MGGSEAAATESSHTVRKMITITLNSQPREVPPGTSVADLVRLLGLEGQACAVEVNKLLVPRRRHAEQGLKTGDVVELVTLVGGG